MSKCVYCGNVLKQETVKAKVHTRTFEVCSVPCGENMQAYVKGDKKYKLFMFLMIFAAGIGFLTSALFGKGRYQMLAAYLGQILGGAAFIIYPYPVMSFETFEAVPIKKVIRVCRVLGIGFCVWGMVLIGALVK